MQFSPRDQLAALADTIAAHECQLKAISSTLSALSTELDCTLDALAWDRAKLQGLLILASQPQPSITTGDEAAVDDGSEAKLEIAGATEATDDAALEPAAAIEEVTTIKGADAGTGIELAQIGVTGLADVAGLTAEDADEIAEPVGDSHPIGNENWIEQAAVPASGTSMTSTLRVLDGEAQAQAETAPAEAAVAASPADPVSGGIVPEAVVAVPVTVDAVTADATTADAVISDAKIEDVVAAPPAAQPVEAPVAETKVEAVEAEAKPVEATSTPNAAVAAATGQVIDLAARRGQRSRGKMRIVAAAVAASLVAVVTAAGFYTGALNSELGANLSRLGACSAEAIATDRGCAVLAWLSL